MSTKSRKKFILTGALFLLFAAFTVVAAKVDVKPIGPKGSEVSMASLNLFMFGLFGVNLFGTILRIGWCHCHIICGWVCPFRGVSVC